MIGYLFSACFAMTTLVLGVAYLVLRKRFYEAEAKWRREDRLVRETSVFFHESLDNRKHESHLADFSAFLITGMNVDGVLIAQQPLEKSEEFDIITGTGVFSDLDGSDAQVRQPRGGSAFAWTSTPQRLNASELREILPEGGSHAEYGLVGPLKMDPKLKGFVLLVRGEDKSSFDPHDQQLLNECINVAELGLALQQTHQTIDQLKKDIETAHEEGMLQVSSGLIHNIGNGIATIQVALNRFKSGGTESLREIADLLGNDVLPEIETQLANKTLQEFLENDEQGKEYLGAFKLLIGQINDLLDTHHQELEFIADKFENITEIVDLQQRFIGELGTESMCSMDSLISHVLTHCKASLEKQDIDLKVDIRAEEQILVDRPMFHHIFALLLQQAIEAARLTPSDRPRVKVSARSDVADHEGMIVIKVSDNGVGDDINLSDTSQLKQQGSKARLISDLLFVRKIIEKYSGTFELKAKYGSGLDRVICIPFKDDDNDPKGG